MEYISWVKIDHIFCLSEERHVAKVKIPAARPNSQLLLFYLWHKYKVGCTLWITHEYIYIFGVSGIFKIYKTVYYWQHQ